MAFNLLAARTHPLLPLSRFCDFPLALDGLLLRTAALFLKLLRGRLFRLLLLLLFLLLFFLGLLFFLELLLLRRRH